MKKIFSCTVILTMVLTTGACSVQTTSTASFSTSVTDADGKTTTTETVIENGVSGTSTITSSEDDPTGLRNKWHELFEAGAEGVSEDGNNVYFIYNTSDASALAAIMITDGESGELLAYDFGDIEDEEERLVIYDVDGESSLPFTLEYEGYENGFLISFQNDDSAFLSYADLDTIIDHMISIWEVQQESYQQRSQDQE
ncbi:MAG: hypothetical protein IKF68_04735 [Erysipelotrichaceae bacterium]|nr:hypothetical protein [Erysipelotrichaceae bacterium]